MAEAITVLGAAAAVAQLFNYSRKARDCFAGIIDGTRTLDDLAGQINDIATILIWIRSTDLEEQCRATMARCVGKLSRLSEVVGRLQDARKNVAWRRVRMLTTWARKEKEVMKLMENIFDVEFNLLKMYFLIQDGHGAKIRCGPMMERPTLSNSLPSRNLHFCGRADVLDHIKMRLDRSDVHTRLAIVGLGGTGKSELAIEFAHRVRKDQPGELVIYVRATNELEFTCSYWDSARKTRIVSTDLDLDASTACQSIKNFLDMGSSGKWLLIVDGADAADTFFGPKSIADLLPEGPNGNIIFTSRNRNLALELVQNDPASLIHLGPLPLDDAVGLYTVISNDGVTNKACKSELVNEVECLPLAVMQAAVFVQQNPIDTAEYLRAFRQSHCDRYKLLGFSGTVKNAEPTKSVLKTWLISFDQIRKDSSFAANLFSCMACLHFHAIPYALFLEGNENFVDVISALGLLEAYSLIRTHQESGSVDMHPLVHFALRYRLMSTEEVDKYTQQALKAVFQAFPSMFRTKPQLVQGEKLILHAQTVLNDSEVLDFENLQLTSKVSLYLRVTGNFADSLHFAELHVEKSRQLTGERSSRTLEALSELALAHQALGNYQQCQSITEQVLAHRKRILSSEHPDSLASMNNLGLILQKRGAYKEAEEVHWHALKVKERVLGVEHDSTVKSLNNYGLALQDQAKYAAAQECFQRVATIRNTFYGRSHTGTLLAFNNLAVIFQLQGKFLDAEHVYLEVLSAREELLGPKHHNTLRSKGNLAINFLQRGEYKKAEGMTREVLEHLIETVGENHLETFDARINLANVFYHQGNPERTAKIYQEVFEARKILLGEDHPVTRSCRSFLDDLRAELEAKEASRMA